MLERSTSNENFLQELIDYANAIETELNILLEEETDQRTANYKELENIKNELKKTGESIQKLQSHISALNMEAEKQQPNYVQAKALVKMIKRESSDLATNLGSLNRSTLSRFQQGVAITLEALVLAPVSAGYIYLATITCIAVAGVFVGAFAGLFPAILLAAATAAMFFLFGMMLFPGIDMATKYIASEVMANYNQSKIEIDSHLANREMHAFTESKTKNLNELRPAIRHFSKCTKIGFFNDTMEQINQQKAIIKTKNREAKQAKQEEGKFKPQIRCAL